MEWLSFRLRPPPMDDHDPPISEPAKWLVGFIGYTCEELGPYGDSEPAEEPPPIPDGPSPWALLSCSLLSISHSYCPFAIQFGVNLLPELMAFEKILAVENLVASRNRTGQVWCLVAKLMPSTQGGQSEARMEVLPIPEY